MELVLRGSDRLRRAGQLEKDVALRPLDDRAEQPIADLRPARLSHHWPATLERPAHVDGRHWQPVNRLRLLVWGAVGLLELPDPASGVGLDAAAQVYEYRAFGPFAVALGGRNDVRGRPHPAGRFCLPPR